MENVDTYKVVYFISFVTFPPEFVAPCVLSLNGSMLRVSEAMDISL